MPDVLIRALVSFGLLVSLALPAQASTLPRADFRQGETTLSASLIWLPLFDLDVDYALSDTRSLGLSVWGFPMMPLATLRLTEVAPHAPQQFSWGWTYSLGVGTGYSLPSLQYFMASGSRTFEAAFYFQPAYTIAVPLWSGQVYFRGTIGPVLVANLVQDGDRRELSPYVVVLWPNAELAFRLTPKTELVLGGNAIAGVRSIF